MAADSRLYLPDISAIFLRFPVSALAAVLLAIYFQIEPNSYWANDRANIMWAGWAAFVAAGIGNLFAEGRDWPYPRNLGLALVLGLAAAALSYFSAATSSYPIMLLGGLILLLSIAAYLRPGASQGALWWFAARLSLSFILGSLVALVFGVGLFLLKESLEFLFEIRIGYDFETRIFSAATLLVAPLYSLALVPRDLDTPVALAAKAGPLLERGVSVLVNFLLVPLVLLFALVLHAYAAKIALAWKLPDGQIGAMSTAFALGGTAAWLIAWPWRETGSWLVKHFIRHWFWLTIVPVIMLTIAVVRRIGDYGVTPERYGLALIALWLGIMGLYFAWRRAGADMRFVLGSLGVLLILGSFGPWGTSAVSVSSQMTRLTAILESQGMLKDGKLVEGKKLGPDNYIDVSSIVYILGELESLDRVAAFMKEADAKELVSAADRWGAHAVADRVLGFSQAAQAVVLNFNTSTASVIDVARPARLIGPVPLATNCDEAAVIRACATLDRVEASFEGRKVSVLVKDVAAKSQAANSTGPPLEFSPEPGVRILITQLYGQLESQKTSLSGMIWIVVEK